MKDVRERSVIMPVAIMAYDASWGVVMLLLELEEVRE